ncbi:MAG: H/ACA ribonucleoprotein complex subunit 2 [Amphiamblys sp. WSBS2006]|nr:MAG: H/ACA ribonucleoprotein complex subunit 2 [Amphiamblys sp. WSBS2006]
MLRVFNLLGRRRRLCTAECPVSAAPLHFHRGRFKLDPQAQWAQQRVFRTEHRGAMEIAHPVVEGKTLAKLQKLILSLKKKDCVKRGTTEVNKTLKTVTKKCLLLIAADTYPLDTISHLPVLCEDNSIPYAFVPKKKDLSAASTNSTPTAVVLFLEPDKGDESSFKKFKKLCEKVKQLGS